MILKIALAIAILLALLVAVGKMCIGALRRFIRTLWPHS
jgi:hypothetical protein